MSDDIRLLSDALERLFAEHADPLAWRREEEAVWPKDLWTALGQGGFLDLLVSEDRGGGGAGLIEALALLKAAGRSSARGPIGETLVLRGLLAGTVPDEVWRGRILTLPAGAASLAAGPPHTELSWCPWGRAADVVVASIGPGGTLAAWTGLRPAGESVNIAGEPRDAVALEGPGARAEGRQALPGEEPSQPVVLLAAAFIRAGQMSGAIEEVLGLTVRYAQERSQFGRPIGQFQAIQHLLAQLATESAAASQAAVTAARAIDRAALKERSPGGLSQAFAAATFEIAAAKSRVGEAAGRAAAIAHQVHGALGFTEEHRLHRLTRRLWSWRAEAGAEAYWNAWLGRRATACGADGIWADLTARG